MKMMLIPADPLEKMETVEREPSLEVYQEIVGGYIEAVRIEVHLARGVMYVNEEGKLDGLPPNPRASLIGRLGGGIRRDDMICGNVVLIGPPDDDGEGTGLSEELEYWAGRVEKTFQR